MVEETADYVSSKNGKSVNLISSIPSRSFSGTWREVCCISDSQCDVVVEVRRKTCGFGQRAGSVGSLAYNLRHATSGCRRGFRRFLLSFSRSGFTTLSCEPRLDYLRIYRVLSRIAATNRTDVISRLLRDE